MDRFFPPSSMVFTLAWAACAASWLYALAESLGLALMLPFAFRSGPLLLRREIPAPGAGLAQRLAAHPGVKAKLAGPGQWLVREQARPGRRSPYPAKARIIHQGGKTILEVRGQAGPTWFVFSWMVGWAVGAAMARAQTGPRTWAHLALGWALGALMLGCWRWYRARRGEFLALLIERLAAAPPPEAGPAAMPPRSLWPPKPPPGIFPHRP